MATQLVNCPIPVDRKYRGGWSGDPATRFTRCSFAVAYPEGQWSEFPNGPHHTYEDEALERLRDHAADHDPHDLVALHHWRPA